MSEKTEPDTTTFAAMSGKTGELITRNGRILLASRTDWEAFDKTFHGITLIPVTRPLFGALPFVDKTGRSPLDDILDTAWAAAKAAIERQAHPQRLVFPTEASS